MKKICGSLFLSYRESYRLKAKLKKDYNEYWKPYFSKGKIYEFERLGDVYVCKKDEEGCEHRISAFLFKKEFRGVYPK